MAVSHIAFNDQLPHGRKLRAAINKLDEGLVEYQEVLEIMGTMQEESQAGPYLASKFGFASAGEAEAAYETLAAVRDKFLPILADMSQLFRRFG